MGKLTDIQIRSWIKAGERFESRGDGDGLYMRYREVDAVPLWRFRYRFDSKPRIMNIGSYTSLSLADARRTAKELRARVAMGHDVAAEKQDRKKAAVAKIEDEKNALSVGQLADEYFERMLVIENRKSGLDPIAHSTLVNLVQAGSFIHSIAAVYFGEVGVVEAFAHV